MKKRFSEEQIVAFLREAEAELPIKELCRKHGFREASYYLWRGKFGGMSVPDAKRLKGLEIENARLMKLLAEQVRYMVDKGLSERRALCAVRMSASALRHEPRPDRNVELREPILALANRPRCHAVGLIHLKLRPEGRLVNYKRVGGSLSISLSIALWRQVVQE